MVGEQGKLQKGIWKSEVASLMGYQIVVPGPVAAASWEPVRNILFPLRAFQPKS